MPKGFLLHRPASLSMAAPNPKKRLLQCALIEFAELPSASGSHDEVALPPSPVSPGSGRDSPVNLTTGITSTTTVSTSATPLLVRVEPPLTPDYICDIPAVVFTNRAASAPKSEDLTNGGDTQTVSSSSSSRSAPLQQGSPITDAAAGPPNFTHAPAVGVPHEVPASPQSPSGRRLSTSKFTCKLCRLNFSDPLSLARHVCAAIRPVEYRCPECDKVFNNPANLASHRRWHKPAASQQLQCPHCKQHFRRNSLLKKHIESEHSAPHHEGPQSSSLQDHERLQQQHLAQIASHSLSYQSLHQDVEERVLLHANTSVHLPSKQNIFPVLTQPLQKTASLIGGQLTSLHSQTNTFVLHGLMHHPESPFMPPLPSGIH